jgi:hypothetical protein
VPLGNLKRNVAWGERCGAAPPVHGEQVAQEGVSSLEKSRQLQVQDCFELRVRHVLLLWPGGGIPTGAACTLLVDALMVERSAVDFQ